MNDVVKIEKTAKKMNKPASKPRGRPLEFNQEQALDKALNVFWLRGYEGTSMAELTEALGINKPSIYAAFGNKEALFRKALERYRAGPASFVAEAMQQPTAYQAAESLLTQAADFFSDKSTPNGCMIVQGALTCGQSAHTIQQELVVYRGNFEATLKKRFEQAKLHGDLTPNVDTKQLAKYIATIHQGMSVQATSGATREELLAVVSMAMKNWPS